MDNESVIVDYDELGNLVNSAKVASVNASNAASFIDSAGGGVPTSFVGKTEKIVGSVNEFSSIISEVEGKVNSILSNLDGDTELGMDADRGLALTEVKDVADIDVTLYGYETEEELAFYNEYVSPLLEKINFEKMGYTTEEIVEDAINWYKNPVYDEEGYELILAEDILGVLLNEVTDGLENCNFNKERFDFRNENEKNYAMTKASGIFHNVFMDTVNIGGYDIDIVQTINKERSSPLYDTVMDAYKYKVVEHLASYPDKMLKAIGCQSLNNNNEMSPSRVVITEDVKGVTNWDLGGFYLKGTVVISSKYIFDYYNLPKLLDHEFGHMFDDFSLDSAHSGTTIVSNDRENFQKLSEENFLRMEEIASSENEFDGDFAKPKNQDEMFAELSKFYYNYPEELKTLCPEYYEYFENYLKNENGEITYSDKNILINGNLINEITFKDGEFKVSQ